MTWIRWQVLLVSFVLISAAGCSREAVKYQQEMAKLDQDLANAVQQYANNVKAKPGDPANFKQAHDQLSQEVGRLVKQAKAVSAPNVSEGKEIHKAFGEYFDVMEKIVQVDYLRIANEANPAASKKIETEVQDKARAATEKMKVAQRSFAKANNFKLIE